MIDDWLSIIEAFKTKINVLWLSMIVNVSQILKFESQLVVIWCEWIDFQTFVECEKFEL